MNARTALVLVATAFALAGCGGASSASPDGSDEAGATAREESGPATTAPPVEPEREALVDRADAICRAASDREAEVGLLHAHPQTLRRIGPEILAIRRERSVASARSRSHQRRLTVGRTSST